jgi:salicylate hydroxylase
MTPNAMNALRLLGLEESAMAVAFEPESQILRSWRSGRVIYRTPVKGVFRERFGAPLCSFPRADLLSVLAAPLPDRAIRLDARCGADSPRFTRCMCWRLRVPVERIPPGLIEPSSLNWMGPHGHVVHYYVRRGEMVDSVAIRDTDQWTEESWIREADCDELFDREPLPQWTKGRVTKSCCGFSTAISNGG